MSASVVIEVLLAILSVMIGVGSFLGASRAAKFQATPALAEIDAKAYERAKQIYESAIDTMDEQIKRLHVNIDELNKEVTTLRRTNSDLISEMQEMRITNMRLENRLKRLEKNGDV